MPDSQIGWASGASPEFNRRESCTALVLYPRYEAARITIAQLLLGHRLYLCEGNFPVVRLTGRAYIGPS